MTTQHHNSKDPELWQLAQRRASFKSHFIIYLIMSFFFWALWFFTGGRTYGNGVPWPVWPMLGWGIGVAFHYVGAFVSPKSNAAEREYEKLVREQNNTNI